MSSISIPREIQVRYGIQRGAVFRIQRTHDKKEHYCVVLNDNPSKDPEIILVSATTKHLKERTFNNAWEFAEDTLVIIEDGQSSAIVRKSTFNCNRYKHPTLNDLCSSVDYKRVEYTGKVIEENIFQELRSAILRSKRLIKRHRKYLN
jgi:hypothetical protein